MAGGMSRRTGGPSFALAEVEARRAARARSDGGDQAVAARHCWVIDPHYAAKLPGLLLRWEPDGSRWRALVVYAVPGRDRVVQEWLTEDRLAPT